MDKHIFELNATSRFLYFYWQSLFANTAWMLSSLLSFFFSYINYSVSLYHHFVSSLSFFYILLSTLSNLFTFLLLHPSFIYFSSYFLWFLFCKLTPSTHSPSIYKSKTSDEYQRCIQLTHQNNHRPSHGKFIPPIPTTSLGNHQR